MDAIQFAPLYQERVWGGRALAERLGRNLPPGPPIGESWEVVDRPEAVSPIRGGPGEGWTLRRLLADRGAEVLGPDWPAHRPFPILVKWLDCRDRLSLQVHPPAEVAPVLGGEPKTENWYIAEAAPGAAVLAGLAPGVTRAAFAAALADGTVESLVRRWPVGPGDSLFVPSGRVHAIDAGCLILEIQQNSDTTYRVYDWGRVGLDGRPRALHLEESLRSIDFADPSEGPVSTSARTGEILLAECPHFRIRKFDLPDDDVLSFPAGQEARLFHAVAGVWTDQVTGLVVRRGDTVLLPWAGSFAWAATGPAAALVTDRFSGLP